jgi:hypothetical protein
MRSGLVVVALLLGICRAAGAAGPQLQPFGAVGGAPAAPWKVSGLPQQKKPYTKFSVVELDGKKALKVEADESYGNLVHPLDYSTQSAKLAWQWRIDQPIEAADLREKSGDDTALKVCVFFDLSIDRIGFGERQLLRYARSQTEDPVPAATVCYVWDPHLPAGTDLENAFTRRMRYVVVRSGGDKLKQWVTERRDVAADFLRLFKGESDTVPKIIGVAIGADADNTRSHSVGYVSGITLEP